MLALDGLDPPLLTAQLVFQQVHVVHVCAAKAARSAKPARLAEAAIETRGRFPRGLSFNDRADRPLPLLAAP